MSLQGGVSSARQMLPMIELFLGAHCRAYTLFGTRSRERDGYVQAGLQHFIELPLPPEEAAAWLTQPTATEAAWDKVAELLLDFIEFLGRQSLAAPQEPHTLAKRYVHDSRPTPPPARLSDGQRRRGRG
jgi:hypothetical protein